DPEFIERNLGLLETFSSYFNPEVRDRLPDKGPFLIVGNHNGGATPPDMPILMTEWWKQRGVDEPVYGLFHSFFFNLPGVGPTMRKAGGIEADPESAERVLRAGGSVVVFPGGDHDVFRPWTERHHIDFAGRTGWIRLALRTGVPIVPAVSCGAHNSVVVLSRGDRLVRWMPHLRLMRVKVMPVMLGLPWGISFGLPTIPLPSTSVRRSISPSATGRTPTSSRSMTTSRRKCSARWTPSSPSGSVRRRGATSRWRRPPGRTTPRTAPRGSRPSACRTSSAW